GVGHLAIDGAERRARRFELLLDRRRGEDLDLLAHGEQPTHEGVDGADREFEFRAGVVRDCIDDFAEPLADDPARLREVDAKADGHRFVVRQLPGCPVEIGRDLETFGYGELGILPFYYRDVLHAIEAKDLWRRGGQGVRTPYTVPMAPGQHQAVWLDHALALGVASN